MPKRYTVPTDTRAELIKRFTYHPPIGDQVERYAEIRTQAFEFGLFLSERCPVSRELSLALTKLDEVVMHANSAIARNEVATKAAETGTGAKTHGT